MGKKTSTTSPLPTPDRQTKIQVSKIASQTRKVLRRQKEGEKRRGRRKCEKEIGEKMKRQV
jgi:hypothetical protein